MLNVLFPTTAGFRTNRCAHTDTHRRAQDRTQAPTRLLFGPQGGGGGVGPGFAYPTLGLKKGPKARVWGPGPFNKGGLFNATEGQILVAIILGRVR